LFHPREASELRVVVVAKGSFDEALDRALLRRGTGLHRPARPLLRRFLVGFLPLAVVGPVARLRFVLVLVPLPVLRDPVGPANDDLFPFVIVLAVLFVPPTGPGTVSVFVIRPSGDPAVRFKVRPP